MNLTIFFFHSVRFSTLLFPIFIIFVIKIKLNFSIYLSIILFWSYNNYIYDTRIVLSFGIKNLGIIFLYIIVNKERVKLLGQVKVHGWAKYRVRRIVLLCILSLNSKPIYHCFRTKGFLMKVVRWLSLYF